MDIKIEDLTEKQAKEILKRIVEKLDDLDEEDYFGSEGWRHLFGFEER